VPPAEKSDPESLTDEVSSAITDTADILIVDDDESVRESLSQALRREGHGTFTCEDFDSAVRAMDQRFFPVVIVDIRLPGKSGIALLDHIHEFHTNVQVIMITGDPTVVTAREAIRRGAYDYISKPYGQAELASSVGRALARHRLLQEKLRLEKENLLYQQALEQLVERRSGQLRESEERYRVLFHRAIDAIFLLDFPEGTIRDLNLAASKLVGLPTEQVIGQRFERFAAKQLDEVLSDVADGKGDQWRLDSVLFHPERGDARRLQLSIGAIEIHRQKILQVICRDITEALALEERQRQMEMELLSEQRLASIGLLASGVAHNINTPLMGVYGVAQLMKTKYPDQVEVDNILAQAERVHAIIQNMMWKSRQDQDKSAQELDLNQLLREELKFLEADLNYKHNVKKEFQFAPDLPPVVGVYHDYSQAVMNIVRNALDAMWDCESCRLGVSTAHVHDDIVIEIEDTGCGIPPDQVDEIFKPFFTTKPLMGKQKRENEPVGTGLGLSTARRLMEPYGVRFQVESTVGRGTKFTLFVPIQRPDTSSKDEALK